MVLLSGSEEGRNGEGTFEATWASKEQKYSCGFVSIGSSEMVSLHQVKTPGTS